MKLHIKLVAVNARFTHSCLALFCVRNELERECENARIDLCQYTINDPYYEVLLHIMEGSPDYVFFSAAVWNSDTVEQLIRDLTTNKPECGIVVGGPQARVIGEHLPSLCTVVVGEIEAVPYFFYEDLQGRCLKAEYFGSFLQSRSKRLAFPYRDSDFAGPLLNRNIYYESSRGCPFSCSYCLSSVEHGVFHKEIAQVENELSCILRHQPRTLRFVDRTFNDRPDRALAIWQFLLEQPGDTLFHFEIAPDRFTEEMFTLLEHVPVGRFQFEIGVQSTHLPTLTAVGRKIDTGTSLRNIQRLADMGTVFLHADLILGLPEETKEMFGRSFSELFATGAHYLQMGLLKLLPDTKITRSANAHGYLSSCRPPYPVIASRWMDHNCLRELYWFCECVEKFVNNRYFNLLWSYLRRKGDDIFLFFQDLSQMCRRVNFFSLAPTQEFMIALLVEKIGARRDGELLLEICCYDWLRCGHRFLPLCLRGAEGSESMESMRDVLYQKLPTELSGVYGRGQKNQFFRKTIFFRFTGKLLLEIGISGKESGVLAFLPEREKSLFSHCRTVLLE